MELRFEWDERKNALNQKKHGVSFEEAAVVFRDPKRIEMFDIKHSIFEDRLVTVGFGAATLLLVIFTEQNGSIRIITARKAKKKNKEVYLNGYDKVYINR